MSLSYQNPLTQSPIKQRNILRVLLLLTTVINYEKQVITISESAL